MSLARHSLLTFFVTALLLLPESSYANRSNWTRFRVQGQGGLFFNKSNESNIGLFNYASNTDTAKMATSGLTVGGSLAYFYKTIGLRAGYSLSTTSNETGSVHASSTEVAGTSSRFADSNFSSDLLLRFGTGKFSFFLGGGALYHRVTFVSDYTGKGLGFQDDRLRGTGSKLGFRGLLGLDYFFTSALGLSLEGGYQALKVTEFKADEQFQYSADSSPNEVISAGAVIKRRAVTGGVHSFSGENLALDLSGPFSVLSLVIRF